MRDTNRYGRRRPRGASIALACMLLAAVALGAGRVQQVTVHEGTSMALALSPDRSRIAIDLQGVIFVLPASGGPARRLTDALFDARQPTWSPDGGQIAFQSNRDGHWRVWIMNADGSRPHALTHDAYEEREPSWSPDGRRIAFTSDRSGKFDIWELDLSNGALAQRTTAPGGNSRPTWSPDGREIAYVSDRAGAAGIYAVDPAGVERRIAAADVVSFGGMVKEYQIRVDPYALKRFGEGLSERFGEVRTTLDKQLGDLATESSKKLDEMRQTVDEKLHRTLEDRLASSFKTVSERLEQVHKGLGEMQSLAAGVGDLKRVLTNVKTRGSFGEVQLGALLEQFLAPDQYLREWSPRPGDRSRVDYAVRLPGRDEPCYLPIDAKFPQEDYQRLLEAHERADAEAMEASARAIEQRIKEEARGIRDKYLNPPLTTDFAVLFLPTEGLYAEVLRRPGLTEFVQREYRVVVSGPTTLVAYLNSLQMGFRTLAIEKRSGEVWKVLGAVKTEFGKFSEVLASTRSKLQQASDKIGEAEHRSRQMARKLRDVETLPAEAARELLGAAEPALDEADAEENVLTLRPVSKE